MRALGFLIVLTISAALPGRSLHASATLTSVALEGRGAQGLGGARFSDLLLRSINASGDVAFSSHLSGDGVLAGVNDDALFVYHASNRTISLIAREGDSAPGFASSVYSELPTHERMLLDNSGRVAFGARLYDNSTGASSKAIFFGPAASPNFVAAVPIVPNDSFPDNLTPFLHSSGQFLFLAELISWPPYTKMGGWQKLTPTGPQYVLRIGDRAPMSGVTQQRTFTDLIFLAANSSGQILLEDDLTIAASPYYQSSLWTGTIENPRLVAAAGDEIPNSFNPALSYDSFSTFDINNEGEIAVGAIINGPSFPSVAASAVVAGPPDDLRLVAATKMPAPGTAEGVVFLAAGSPRLNDSGKLIFKGLLSGPEVTASNDGAIYVMQPTESSPRLLAREGDQAPATEPGAVFTSFGQTGLNNRGVAVFRATLSGPGINEFNNQSLWFEYDGVTRLLLRGGQELEVAEGDVRTLGTFVWSAENGTGGAGMGFNDNNQLLIEAYFTDHTHGIFIVTVPEPGQVGWLGIGMIALLLGRLRPRLALVVLFCVYPSPLLAKGPASYDPTPDFIAYNPEYKQLKRKYREELNALQAEMISKQKAGRKTPCTRQVFLEAKWYLYYTAHFDKSAERIAQLREMLKLPKDPHDGSQIESDGSYGCCSTIWFKKLDVTTDKLITLAQAWKEPKYPLKLLEEINSPEKLTAYLDSILISDVSKTGRDHRYEHNSSLSSLTRYICWEGTWEELPIKFKLHPKLYETLIDIEDNKLQDPDTRYWGAWYRTREGQIVKTADLSHTFHIVHFRHGQVERWPRIIATTLAIKDQEYPTGWLEDGKMTNHHNYDVALLLHLGFEHATAQQKKQIGAEVQRMLDFCLNQTLLADGSFKTDDEDTLGAAFYFGVAFLHEIGYFSKVNRFWTDREFPEARAINDRITARIRALGLDDPEALFALRLLAANKIAAGAQQQAR